MPYDYIAHYYGTRFKPGQRVIFTEDGRRGTVLKPAGDPQYVDVKFDAGGEGPCHPMSLAFPPVEELPHIDPKHLAKLRARA